MATFITKPNKIKKKYYYAKIQNSEWLKPKFISLGDVNTSYKEARKRYRIIENEFEKEIKQGVEFESYGWEVGSRGKAKSKIKTLALCVDEWLERTKVSMRKSSHDRYRVSLNCLINVMGKTCPIKNINNKSIEDFKRFYLGKHTKGGIDINLRGIKKFLLWCLEEGYIKKMPKVIQFNEKTPPKYINQVDWNRLMECDADDYSKDLWRVYRDLGLRLKEIIWGEIEGDFLIVKAEDTKSNKILETPITEEQKGIIQAIHTKRDEHISEGKKIINFRDRISKTFKRWCKRLGMDYNFHCLRHTFAVRKYIETRDIMLVSKMMNHESLQPTEQYTKFNIYRLEQEFPSLVQKQEKNTPKNTLNSTTPSTKYINPRLYN